MLCMVIKKNPPLEVLDRLFSYDKETGVLTRRFSANGLKEGEMAGSLSLQNYFVVRVAGKSYQVSRIAWSLGHREDPWPYMIDHINRIRTDNRLRNLRLVSRQQNQMNSSLRKNNTSGAKGVSWKPKIKSWAVRVTHKGVEHHGGYHKSFEVAVEVAKTLRKVLHGSYAS